MTKYKLYENVILKDQPVPNMAYIAATGPLDKHYIIVLMGWMFADGSVAKLVHESEITTFGSAIKPEPNVPKKNDNKVTIPYDTLKEWIGIWDEDNPPYTPYYTPSYPLPLPNDAIGKCMVCGRDMFQLDMYCCPNSRCPSRSTITC